MKRYFEIGEIFEINGKIVTPIIGGCNICALNEYNICSKLDCLSNEREDRLKISFVEIYKSTTCSKYLIFHLINIKNNLAKTITDKGENLNDNEEYHKLNIMISNLKEIQEYAEKIL